MAGSKRSRRYCVTASFKHGACWACGMSVAAEIALKARRAARLRRCFVTRAASGCRRRHETNQTPQRIGGNKAKASNASHPGKAKLAWLRNTSAPVAISSTETGGRVGEESL